MHREEADQYVACADCGATVLVAPDRAFAFGEQSALCWECAMRRGGSYDADQDRWTEPPDVSDLEKSEPA